MPWLTPSLKVACMSIATGFSSQLLPRLLLLLLLFIIIILCLFCDVFDNCPYTKYLRTDYLMHRPSEDGPHAPHTMYRRRLTHKLS
jgi:hypothetical protein